MKTRSAVAAMIVAGLCLPLAACDQATAGAPVTLRIGTDDVPGVPAAAQIEQFASEVSELSDGRITIEPVWGAAGSGIKDWDQAIAQLVIDGDLDLAVVPSRSWDSLGVTSLRPINAPFLIDSDALVEEVLTSDVADAMMAGLESVGVTGLGMWTEGLRHPFGYTAAIDGSADFDGAVVRTATSSTTSDVFAALGATTNDDAPSAAEHTAIESSFILKPGGVATGNVTFYPKVNVLVGGSDRLAELTDADRSILETAAQRTQAWAFKTQPKDPEAAKKFCDGGGSVHVTTSADIVAMTDATRPVIDDIAADAGNKAVLDEIAALKSTLPDPPAVEACSGAVAEVGVVDTSLDGVYRYELTPQDYYEAGFPDEGSAADNSGTFTWTLANGTWHTLQQRAGSPDWQDTGTFTIEGSTLVLDIPSIPGIEKFEVDKDSDGTLHLEPVKVALENEKVFVAGKPWVRVGDAPAMAVLDGTYRTVVTEQQLLDAGTSANDARVNSGTYTFVLTDGTWHMHWEATDASEDFDGVGTYEVSGNHVTFIDPSSNSRDVFTWARTPGTDLTMSVAGSGDKVVEAVWGDHPWEELPSE